MLGGERGPATVLHRGCRHLLLRRPSGRDQPKEIAGLSDFLIHEDPSWLNSIISREHAQRGVQGGRVVPTMRHRAQMKDTGQHMKAVDSNELCHKICNQDWGIGQSLPKSSCWVAGKHKQTDHMRAIHRLTLARWSSVAPFVAAGAERSRYPDLRSNAKGVSANLPKADQVGCSQTAEPETIRQIRPHPVVWLHAYATRDLTNPQGQPVQTSS